MSEQPLVRIVRGTPTAEELAALVGILLVGSGDGPATGPVPSRWARSARPGARPTSWRAAALPG
ncbi:MAG: acyl-CoA carboxylase subunit epsilon [Gemmatimonadales bacterium]